MRFIISNKKSSILTLYNAKIRTVHLGTFLGRDEYLVSSSNDTIALNMVLACIKKHDYTEIEEIKISRVSEREAFKIKKNNKISWFRGIDLISEEKVVAKKLVYDIWHSC